MKKIFALLVALMLLCISVMAQEADTQPEVSLQQVVTDAEALMTLVADSMCEESFKGRPNQETAALAINRHAQDLGYEDGQVLSMEEMETLYAQLFAHGAFADLPIGTQDGPQGLTEEGYTLVFGAGDRVRLPMVNAYEVFDDSIVCDVSFCTVGHEDYPMNFAGNARVYLQADPDAPYGALVEGMELNEMPYFDAVSSNAQLGDQAGNTYDAANAVDGKYDTCWAYRVSQSEDPALVLSAQEEQAVRGVVLTPGYAKNETVFTNNRRVAQLMVTLDGGEQFIVDLPDVESMHYDGTYVLSFGGIYPTRTVTIQVVDSYEGEKYDDVCISEIFMF